MKIPKRVFGKSYVPVIIFFCLHSVLFAGKKPLDHSVYDEWDLMRSRTLSQDGLWVASSFGPDEKDGKFQLLDQTGKIHFEGARIDSMTFGKDSKSISAKIRPSVQAVRQAKKDKLHKLMQPKDSLLYINLRTLKTEKLPRVKRYEYAKENGEWLAWLAEIDTTGNTKPDTLKRLPGAKLTLRNTRKDLDFHFENVNNFRLSKNGSRLLFTRISADSLLDGIYTFSMAEQKERTVWQGKGKIMKIALSEDGISGAFIYEIPDTTDNPKVYELYLIDFKLQNVAEQITDSILKDKKDDLQLSPWWPLYFSKSGQRLFCGVTPIPEKEPKDTLFAEEKIDVEIWHWQDPQLQTVQKVRLEKEKKRSWTAFYDLNKKDGMILGSKEIPEIYTALEGDSRFILGKSDLPYQKEISWDYPSYYDYYLIDTESGQVEKILPKLQWDAALSPGGKFLFWWDRTGGTWLAMETETRNVTILNEKISQTLKDELHDWPYFPDPYGFAGWTEDDKAIWLYDRYDIWEVNPKNGKAKCLTGKQEGRKKKIQFRYIKTDPDEQFIPLKSLHLLSAFNDYTKESGFYGLDRKKLTPYIFGEKRYRFYEKALDGNAVLYSQEDFAEFPNLWIADEKFEQNRQVTNLNLQQADYLWGNIELIEWNRPDGSINLGLLCKPEAFNPNQKYPMIIYFYERNSDSRFAHRAPQAYRSIINPTLYTSNGYLVFIPDIHYEVGYPGKSALETVNAGVDILLERGYVDNAKMGLQGHSWGGYQIAYMVTQTNRFAAASAGAPVSNMTSAYGGIRGETGLVRQFQYEKTQSRLGATPWENRNLYLENSPLFYADKVQTPLLMMHNDADGHVPFQQGVEYFVALRRLNKPAWLINYTGEVHWPETFAERKDWAIRMQQFFDHYLKGKPAPIWLKEGIPAIEKGKTLGYELAD
jgi:dipeptidyl aminopeptidase/acylaminoacyl peptidase